MKRVLIAMIFSLSWIGSARAQTCAGSLSYTTAPLQVGIDAAFSSDSHTFVPGVGFGKDAFFARGGAEFISFSGLDDSAKGIVGMAGAEYKVEAARPLFVCPMITVVRNWGPSIDVDTSSWLVNIGGSVGFVAAKNGQTTIIPSAALSFNHLSTTGTFNFLGTSTSSTAGGSFGSLQFGAGFIFNDRMSLFPSIIVPFGGQINAQTSFSVLFAMKVG
jgi:hypothetical protein